MLTFRLIIGCLVICFSSAIYAIDSGGTIQGQLAWPGESLPRMKICAEEVNTKKVVCKRLSANNYKNKQYSWKLPVGTYYIYAQLLKNEGEITTKYHAYYSEFVTCGEKSECTSHKPIPVTIRDKVTLTDINPTDWYI